MMVKCGGHQFNRERQDSDAGGGGVPAVDPAGDPAASTWTALNVNMITCGGQATDSDRVRRCLGS